MKSGRKVLIQVLIVSLIGLAGVVGILLLLSQGASASPMLDPVTLSLSKNQIADPTNGDIDLEVTKSGNPNPVIAGETLSYVITITNKGLASATNVVLTDTLPPGVTYVSATPGQGICGDESGGAVTCSLESLLYGTASLTTTTVTITVNVDPSTTGTLTNTADVSANEPDLDMTNNTFDEGTTVNAEANLTLTKTGSPDPVIAGNGLTYTLTVTNTGPSDATGVILTDTLPSGVTFKSASPVCTPPSGDNQVTCNLGGIYSGDHEQVTIVVNVDSSTTVSLSNSATVLGNETDPTPGNNTDIEVTQVDTEVNLTLTKTDDPDPVNAGGDLTYGITFTNTGPSDATSVVITDTLDPNLIYDSASPGPTGFDSNGDPYWSLAPLGPGDSGQVTLCVQVRTPLPNNTILTNTAFIDCHQASPLSVQENTIVHSGPVLSITKTDDPDPVDAGGPLHYTIIITNSGNENATSVTVVEDYDPNVSFFFSDPAPDPGSENKVWTFPTLAVGNPETIDIVVMVASSLPPGTTLTNHVTLDSDQTTPVTIAEGTSVTAASELTVSKIDIPDPVPAGGDLTYIISYQNGGTAPADDVVITEMYDRQVTFVSANPAPRSGTDNVWDIGDLSVGEGGIIRVTVRVDTPLPDGSTLTNRVTIDSVHTSPQNYTEITSVSSPDLAVAAVHEPSLFSPGKLMTYTVTYSNTGHWDADDVIITTTLPPDTTYAGYGWISSDGQTYIYVVDDLPAGAGDQTHFVVRYPDQPQIGAVEFNTPFTISESGSNRDGNLDDNTACVHIGVPDLVVTDFTVEPSSPEAGQPVTFTVVVKNQGTGMAWNPEACIGDPLNPICGGFYVDVFIAPVNSYPFERDGDCWGKALIIEPGLQRTVVIVHSGFSEQEIGEGIERFYVKVDNHGLHPYGLVPEHNEMNNLYNPWSYYAYLPLVFR